MMAALGKIEEAKSEKILDILSKKDLFDIVDGDKAIKKLIQKAIKKKKGLGWSVFVNAFKIYKTLKNKLGINPGTDFERWITRELNKQGIDTIGDLMELRMQAPSGLKDVTTGALIDDLFPDLAIVTSDITTNTKVEFPRMASLYWNDFKSESPAKLVRASMSIPFFFEPFKVTNIPDAGKEKHPLWNENAKYFGPVPASVSFVDGGMLSNFPIDVFHRQDGGVPRMPTFGVRLSTYREEFNSTDSLFGFSGAMISTMRQIHDYDFLMKNPDYRQLICRVNADKDFNWLDFQMPVNEQVRLFLKGAEEAVKFLDEFDWEKYKEVRRNFPGSY
ncbi:hypothetical protein FNH22_12600 [Fulvivirga sp. M361]|uniref:patatin-like phospholipase family protein n=1 Tax=Fulvivirga sp. M361 TaxID=2594266 RepID=UPI001179D2EE|nr:patatin-like phospholipase family protein [Fulvivirga sp. M361]TRX58711.1 hypothetical protein FNH22_12600 [Fulvivirga sp. M361]